jgi:FdhD protein|nr:MAG: hypothetical protein DIU52_07845 [bacterium]
MPGTLSSVDRAMTRVAPVDEAPFWIEVNGSRVAWWSCSPERLEALAVGWLRAEGFIVRAEDLVSIEPIADAAGSFGVRASVDPGRAREAERHRRARAESGIGALYYVQHAPELLHGQARTLPLPSPDAIAALFRELSAPNDAGRGAAGVHTAALTDGQALCQRAEDVDGHNAVDKAIGAALLAGEDLGRMGLVLSARVTGEIALKAARCGVAWIASGSVPTTLALRIAAAAGFPIVARAADRDAHVYWPPATEPRP